MKRKDQEPTPENIRVSIADDVAGRNDEIADFIKLLDQIDGPYSLLVDAPWGEGKTFFIKSVETILKVMNSALSAKDPKSSSADKDPSDKKSIMQPSSEQASSQINEADYSRVTKKLTGLKKTFLPFYFNAWENDFASDPLSALFASLAAEADNERALKQWPIGEDFTKVIDAIFSAFGMPLQITPFKQVFTGKNLVEAFKAQQSIRQTIDDIVTNSIKRKGHSLADRIIIFIDELDRCRPEFAVRLLEQVKTLFQNDRIIVVYSADLEELSHAINGFYGPSFKAQKYLSRFFDDEYRLAHIDGFSFFHDGHHQTEQHLYTRLIAELQNNAHETTREASRIIDLIEEGKNYTDRHSSGPIPEAAANCAILPLLIFIYQSDSELFRKITSGQDFDALYEYGKRFSVVRYILKKAIDSIPNTINQPVSEQVDVSESDYMHDLCVILFSQDRHSHLVWDTTDRYDWHPNQDTLRTFRQLRFSSNI